MNQDKPLTRNQTANLYDEMKNAALGKELAPFQCKTLLRTPSSGIPLPTATAKPNSTSTANQEIEETLASSNNSTVKPGDNRPLTKNLEQFLDNLTLQYG